MALRKFYRDGEHNAAILYVSPGPQAVAIRARITRESGRRLMSPRELSIFRHAPLSHPLKAELKARPRMKISECLGTPIQKPLPPPTPDPAPSAPAARPAERPGNSPRSAGSARTGAPSSPRRGAGPDASREHNKRKADALPVPGLRKRRMRFADEQAPAPGRTPGTADGERLAARSTLAQDDRGAGGAEAAGGASMGGAARSKIISAAGAGAQAEGLGGGGAGARVVRVIPPLCREHRAPCLVLGCPDEPSFRCSMPASVGACGFQMSLADWAVQPTFWREQGSPARANHLVEFHVAAGYVLCLPRELLDGAAGRSAPNAAALRRDTRGDARGDARGAAAQPPAHDEERAERPRGAQGAASSAARRTPPEAAEEAADRDGAAARRFRPKPPLKRRERAAEPATGPRPAARQVEAGAGAAGSAGRAAGAPAGGAAAVVPSPGFQVQITYKFRDAAQFREYLHSQQTRGSWTMNMRTNRYVCDMSEADDGGSR